jgi:hypothetical protein
MGTSPEEEPILFLAGTVEPFRVLHQRWRVYFTTKVAQAFFGSN